VSNPDEWGPARRADLITVVSDHDASLVRQNLAKDSVVVSYPVEVRTNLPEFDQRRDFLFVGSLVGSFRMVPNVDGLRWFLTEVLPLLQQSDLPPFKVHIVGQVNSADVLPLSSDIVRFYDKVDDLKAFYDAARVFIAPVRFAAGIPIKVLDAITNGVPAVAAPILRYQLGLDASYPQSFPDPADFARECIRTYADRRQWELERSLQRTLAESRYSSAEFRRSIRQLLEVTRCDPGQDVITPDSSRHPSATFKHVTP
jgi:glycosyltransferase involved in cell wall biosynthesis